MSNGEWTALATSLGELNSRPVPPGLDLPIARPPAPAAVAGALEFWAQLGRADNAERAADLVLGAAIPDQPADSALRLEHGDCHTENIVRDEHNSFRWIDWQEAHLGDGFSDLVFLWQRAEFAGADPPREAMIEEYVRARHLGLEPELRRAVSLAELRLLFISWPPFLSYGTRESQQRMKDRLPQLLETLNGPQ